MRPDHSPYLRSHKHLGTSTHSPLINQQGSRARAYQIHWVDVNYSPVRFGPVPLEELNAQVANQPSRRGLTEFLNPTGFCREKSCGRRGGSSPKRAPLVAT